MRHSHRRDDISDKTGSLLEPHLPGREDSWGGIAKDNRQFINAVFWMLWRDLPPDYGGWSNTHRRFIRWRGIATRYAKNTASFLAAVQSRCIALWTNLSELHYLRH